LENQITIREWLLTNWESFATRAECVNACSDETNRNRRNARKVMLDLENKGIINWGRETGDEQTKKELHLDPKNKIAHLSLVSNVPHTVEDLMNISELDPMIWEVARQRSNFWGNEANPNFQIRAEFIRKISEGGEEFLNALKEDIKKYAPIYPTIKYTEDTTEGYLLEISIYDPHFGLTTETYNAEVATQRYYQAVVDILSWYKDKPISKILLVIGHDTFNANDREGRTVKQNPREESPRWRNTYRLAFETLIASIDLCQSIAPVEVYTVQGNHDADRSFYLAHALEAYYSNCPQVVLHNNDKCFEFFLWGNNLIAMTHGDSCNIKELPMIMATKSPAAFWVQSESGTRVFRIGHKHHKKSVDFISKPIETEDDVYGVRVSMSPSLADHSSWEVWKGYKNIKEACGCLWHKTKGDMDYYNFKILK